MYLLKLYHHWTYLTTYDLRFQLVCNWESFLEWLSFLKMASRPFRASTWCYLISVLPRVHVLDENLAKWVAFEIKSLCLAPLFIVATSIWVHSRMRKPDTFPVDNHVFYVRWFRHVPEKHPSCSRQNIDAKGCPSADPIKLTPSCNCDRSESDQEPRESHPTNAAFELPIYSAGSDTVERNGANPGCILGLKTLLDYNEFFI